jgi:putative SOS response-associated peptidase YedK
MRVIERALRLAAIACSLLVIVGWGWFAIDETQPLFFFAGIWRPWTGLRGTKKEPVEGDHELYTFLTTSPNALVKPVHSKAMPAILGWEDAEPWPNEPIEDAITLQKPAPEGMLEILAPPPDTPNQGALI